MTDPSEAVIDGRASRLRISGAVAEFSHQRPQRRNPLGPELRDDYEDLLQRLAAEPGIRVLIISGSGGSFCAGGDLRSMQARIDEGGTPDEMRRRMLRAHRLVQGLRELELPLIAAVDGPAYGAGFGLALLADYVFASTRAVFCASFARIGAIPDFGLLYTLPRRVGMARAKEMVLSARRVEAAEALALGVADALQPPEALLGAAHELARRLCDGPRVAAGMAKRLLDRSFETDFASMCAFEADAQAVAMSSRYHAEAVARFVAGQPPRYDWDRKP
ncbi:MAG: enoyl-CoA hydratase/isomerase family protein [Proteobacteria bacterium]|nr:enoyl-CoA hydratase/isomerase family protein [Pseudomonadota bacterium]